MTAPFDLRFRDLDLERADSFHFAFNFVAGL